MPRATHTLDETYAAEPSSVAGARARVARFAASVGARPAQVDSVRLAVSEAVTNAVVHGYRGGVGQVRVTADVTDGELWIVIVDDGRGMQLINERPGLGLGLGLIARITDHMTIVPRPDGGTELRMRFDLQAERSAGGDADAAMVAVASPSQA